MRLYKSILTLFFLLATILNGTAQFEMVYVSSGDQFFIETDQNIGSQYMTYRGAVPGYFNAKGTAKFIGASDSKNINGYMKHSPTVANQGYDFLVGNGTDLRQLSVSGTRTASAVIGVAWMVGDPSTTGDLTNGGALHSRNSKGTGITDVSAAGQWDWVDLGANGTAAGGVTVTVSVPDLTGFATADRVRLVGWNGSQWINLSGTSGASGITENSTLSGTIPSGTSIHAIGIGRVQDEADLQIVKTVASADVKVGSNATFTLTLKNNGSNNATNVRVEDVLPAGLTLVSATASVGTWSGASSTWTVPTLNNGETATLQVVATVALTARTKITNTAKIISPTQHDPVTTNNQSSVDVNPKYTGITLTKNGSFNQATNTINYSFVIKNTGNLPLTGVALSDPKLGGNITLSSTTLAAGATINVSVPYTVTTTDLNTGSVSNTATVTSKDPDNANVTDTSGQTEGSNSPTITPLVQTPGVALVKTGVLNAAGTQITYTFQIVNTGNVTLTGLSISDPMLSNTAIVPATTTLGGGASTTVERTYVITNANRDAGVVSNSATVTATPPTGSPITDVSGSDISKNEPTLVEIERRPGIELIKTSGAYNASTNKITYTFKVKNVGNVTLSSVVLTDTKLPSLTLGSNVSIARGDSVTVTADYTPTQAEINAGKVINTASVTSKDPMNNTIEDTSGSKVGEDSPTETVIPSTPVITLVKQGTHNPTTNKIVYSFTIHNPGKVTVNNLVLSDSKISNSIALSSTTIAPNQTISVTGVEYNPTELENSLGVVKNQATVTGTDSQGRPVSDLSGTTATTNDSTSTNVTGAGNASITLVKKNGTYNATAGTLDYRFVIRNRGQVTLTNIVLTDPKIPGLALPVSSLSPGDSTFVTATYTLTAQEKSSRSVENQATVTSKDPANRTVSDISGTTESGDNKTIFTIECSPDLSPSITVTPSNGVVGSRTIAIRFDIKELKGCETDPTQKVYFNVTRVSNFVFDWENFKNSTNIPGYGATFNGLENSDWTFQLVGAIWRWTYKHDVFPADGLSNIGITGMWNSGISSGTQNFTARVPAGISGDDNSTNDSDVARLKFSSN